jgi:PRTRC genetic system protein B
MELQDNLIPKVALIAYEQKNSNYYLESRRIKKGVSGFEMLEGTPLTKKAIAEILDKIDPIKLERIYCDGFLPENLLAYNNDDAVPTIIWYIKSGWHNLSFIKKLNINDGLMHLPTLIFKLKMDNLSVYAIKTKKPKLNSKLYHAPMHNIYSNGNVCMGNAKIFSSNEVSEMMKNWEKAFFQSKFSHLQTQGSPIKGNLNTFIKDQIDNNKIFDNNVLKLFGKKLEDLI